MNEVTIPLKLTGVAQIKAELKSLKDQILNATDPAQMSALADKAGELQKRLNAVNSQIGEFKKGSNFDQVRNSFDGLAMSIMDMDFAKAGKESANLNQTIKSLKPEDLTKQFKGFTSTIGNLGKSFLSLGKVILSNPIFFITAIIIAIVGAIVGLLKYFGVLDDVIKALMIPINILIQGFKDLTDWMGLTSFEAQATAVKMQKANDKSAESSKKRSIKIGDAYDYEIAKAKANGKDITDLEIAKSKALGRQAQGRLNDARREYNYLNRHADEYNMARRKKLREQMAEEKKILADGSKERKLLAIQDVADDKAKNDADAKARAEKAKENAKNRIDASRTIRDIEISLIKDDTEREIATTNAKYTRLAEDVKTNDKLTGAERIKLMKLYEVQRIAELETASNKILEAEKANAKKIADGIKAFNEAEAQEKEDIYEVNYQAGLTRQAKELQDAQYQYEALKAKAERYGEDYTNITNQYLKEKADIEKKYADEDTKLKLEAIEKAKGERDAKLTFANEIANGIGAVGNMLIKDQKKLEKFNKASALVQIGMAVVVAVRNRLRLLVKLLHRYKCSDKAIT